MSEPVQTNRFAVGVQYAAPAVLTLSRSGTVIASSPVYLRADTYFDRVPIGPIDVDVEAAGLVVQSVLAAHVTPSPQVGRAVVVVGSSIPSVGAKELLQETRAAIEEFARALETWTAASVAERLTRIEEKVEAVQAALAEPEG